MSKGNTVLGNLLSHLSRSDFEKAVNQYAGDKKTRVLSSYAMLKTLLYGQAIKAFSVREIESSLSANAKKLYHCGMSPVKKSTLCDAMEKRDHRIFQSAFESLVSKAKLIASGRGRRFKNPLKVIDASTIELCLTRFDWAKFRTTKGAVKLHVAMDGDGGFPEQVRLTNGNVHEVNELDNFVLNSQDLVVFDRGYMDFKRLQKIDLAESTFVTRMKENCAYQSLEISVFPKGSGVRHDCIIQLCSEKGRKDYPKELRQIRYHDREYQRDYTFITNNFELSGQEIADIYKARWQVELFFKWIKQNLSIKTFWGTSSNAVFTQIWVALIMFMLLWLQKNIENVSGTIQRILQLLKVCILGSGNIVALFSPPPGPVIPDTRQLTLGGLKF